MKYKDLLALAGRLEDVEMGKMREAAGEAVKTKRARYTAEQNEMLYEEWWDPERRRELPQLIGRNLTALRSQFCRLLKEKGISNDDYYRLMGERHGSQTSGRYGLRRRMRVDNDRDGIILEIFAKHHALGNTKTKACEELRRVLGIEANNSALKLRFYRLMNKRGLTNQDLVEIGRRVLSKVNAARNESDEAPDQAAGPPLERTSEEKSSDLGFLAHLAHLPQEISEFRRRLGQVEETQRHQLDLRGFIEHLLAVERDLKEEDRLQTELQALHERNYELTHELAAEKKRLRMREEELEGIHQMLNEVLGEYMHLESVAKLASLGDFIHRLEVTVDQFGNVLKCRRV